MMTFTCLVFLFLSLSLSLPSPLPPPLLPPSLSFSPLLPRDGRGRERGRREERREEREGRLMVYLQVMFFIKVGYGEES
jgi:hypothetical protein